MKNIFVACDFSQAANHACRFAIELALATGGKVLVVSIIEFGSVNGYKISQCTYKDQIAVLSELMEKAENDFMNLKHGIDIGYDQVNFFIEVGSVKEMLLKLIREQEIDLVITGASGEKWFEKQYPGSNSEKIAFYMPVPVLTVYGAMHVSEVQNINLALFNSMDLVNDAADKIKALQSCFQAELDIVNGIGKLNTELENTIIALAAPNKTDLQDMLVNMESSANYRPAVWTYICNPN